MRVEGCAPTQLCRSYSLRLVNADPFITTGILKLVTEHYSVYVSADLLVMHTKETKRTKERVSYDVRPTSDQECA
jgi:hypothetical protein